TGRVYQNPFYFWMSLLHIALGILMTAPFVVFGILHMRTAIRRPNRRAVHAGIALFSASLLVLISGAALLKNMGQPWNDAAYWVHVLSPLAAVALYVAHRTAGPAIAWRWGWAWGGSVALFVGAMTILHSQDPRQWNQIGPREGVKYFEPSLARTSTGHFIPAETLSMDEYCLKCHADAYGDWFHSAHHFSSFNNPAYRFSVRETRQVALARDGNTQAARWCAGCHDVVPFFSGKFDDPNYDDLNDPTAHAGITCTTCHAITHINSTRGNADYTIEEPLHYPFAFSENPFLQWVNNRLVKAKPAFHKKTFLKPFHKTAEFCSTCHKVHLPFELNKYKPFLRGQNHYDPYLLSGVSGHGARSFYYPPAAKPNCAEGCHMPLKDSDDFGNQDGKIHDHGFPGANTGLAELRGHEPTRQMLEDFLRDGQMRIDLFGLREGNSIDGRLHAPLRPEIPVLEPGRNYLLEVVLRTLKLGHLFTQGTADSNEIWVEVVAGTGGQALARSGAIDEQGFVDPASHFVNVLMLDRDGNRIDRRNPQDIFVPLYNHQIPPGAGQAIHYLLRVPPGATGPIQVSARLLYRKFDRTYMEYVFGKDAAPNLKPVVLCEDSVSFPVSAPQSVAPPAQTSPIPEWQRWNDYGIGLLLKGTKGSEKGELRQAEEVFKKVAELGRSDGWVNLARVYEKDGRLDEAVAALRKAGSHAEPWVVSWLSGVVNRQNGFLEDAIRDLERVLETRVPERGFDFSLDYEVLNELGLAYFDRSKGETGAARAATLERARNAFEKTLAIDSENMTAHYNLYQIAAREGKAEESRKHLANFQRYRPDDNAADRAIAIHRRKNPAANKSAQSIVIYELKALQ
ncbi:MAG TPA: multiheme c-type cytochrome, partial [Planctomycetota bacterium]|nr:multiheme c-type cytochrome [Planctomycetota bacterium]